MLSIHFLLSRDEWSLVALPHSIEKEKEIILEGKLHALFAAPYKNLDLPKIFQTEPEDGWLLTINRQRIAIQDKTIFFEPHKNTQRLLDALKKREKELDQNISIIRSKISQNITRRLNLIAECSAKVQRNDNSQKYREKEAPIDIAMTKLTSTQEVSMAYPHVAPQSISPFRLQEQSRLMSDLNEFAQFCRNMELQLDSIRHNISHLEEAMRRGLQYHKISHKISIGQVVPDNHEELLDCYYEHEEINCNTCTYKAICDSLIKPRLPVNLYGAWKRNHLDISDIVLSAKQLGIDIDQPMKAFVSFQFQPSLFCCCFENEVIFCSSEGKSIGKLCIEKTDSTKCTHFESYVNETGAAVPFAPAKLFRLDAIANQREAELYFTDCLEFAIFARSTNEGNTILTSYFGGQFDDTEIDFYPFRGRTVHYLLFEHSGYSFEQIFKKACQNYKQIKEQSPGAILDFFILKKEKNNCCFQVGQVLTEEEFCTRYLPSRKNEENNSIVSDIFPNPPEHRTPPLLGPLIESGRYILLAANKHSGKTKFATALAASVASGKELVQILRPERNTPKEVLYLDFELGKEIFEINTQKIIKSFFPSGAHPKLHVKHLTKQHTDIHTEKGIEEITNIINSCCDNLKLLIIDNITAASSNPTSDNSGWRKYTFPFIDSLRTKGITVVVIAHLDDDEISGARQKLNSASECITLARTNFGLEENSQDRYGIKIERDFHITGYPYANTPMEIVIDESMDKATFSFNESYLNGFLSGKSLSADELAFWFNVTPKTIREWRGKLKK